MTKKLDVGRADLDSLLAEYTDAAVTHRHASREGKHKVANSHTSACRLLLGSCWRGGQRGRMPCYGF